MISMSLQRQRGLSLVELMVAMALSLLLMLGVIQIFLSSKQTYSTNSALSRVQESGRFAMEFLAQDIRNTGYKGQCIRDPENHGVANILWRLDDPIKGWNDISAKPTHLSGTPVTDTDAILIKFAAGPGGVSADTANLASNNNIALGTNKSGVNKHAITLVSDAIFCDLFQNTADSNTVSVAKGAGGDWTHDYTSEIEVLALQNATYYIRANNGRPNSLVRERLSTTTSAAVWITEELVEGVQDLQILYGVAGPNRQVSKYVTANNVTDWDDVVAVRLNMLVVSADTNVVPENQVIAFGLKADGTPKSVTINDRRLAQVFSSTIGIRNRLP